MGPREISASDHKITKMELSTFFTQTRQDAEVSFFQTDPGRLSGGIFLIGPGSHHSAPDRQAAAPHPGRVEELLGGVLLAVSGGQGAGAGGPRPPPGTPGRASRSSAVHLKCAPWLLTSQD